MNTSKLRFIIFIGFCAILFSSCKKETPKVTPPETVKIVPTLTTLSSSSVTSTSFSSGGNINSDGGATVTAKGVCWSTSQNPTVASSITSDGSGSDSFISLVSGLSPGTTYYVKAYATNSVGTGYGSQIIVATTTNTQLPVISTTVVSSIAATTAVSGGNITSDGGSAITTRGVCWGTTANPTIANSKTANGTGTGSFSSSLTGLTQNTTYYVRAYATNLGGTAYGSQVSFITIANVQLSTLTTSSVSNITAITAVSGGNVTSDGGAVVTVRGICWNTEPNPTTSHKKTTDGYGMGSFSSSLVGLVANTKYYVRAYANNTKGVAYGNEVSFWTIADLQAPKITTSSITSITNSTATSGGNITSAGGSPVISRGICWSYNQYPTVNNNKITNGTGTGSFICSITGLYPGMIHYVRAYATNSYGTAYGNQISFTTTTNSNNSGIVFNPNLSYGTLSDIDGNKYKTIAIGTQVWMAENLKVTKYNDGRALTLATSSDTWGSSNYSWYNDDISYKNTYGALYGGGVNFNAYGSNVCPVGWHVPSFDDWRNLFKYLDPASGPNYYGSNIVGGILKETGTTHWLSPNSAANNSVGFTGLPGASRRYDTGGFTPIGESGFFWSKTDRFWNIFAISLTYTNGDSQLFEAPTNSGLSIRCIKD